MSDKTLTVVDVEPDWFGMYIDGELYRNGHPSDKESAYQTLLGRNTVFEVEREHINPDRWQGMPKSLDECMELYG